MSNSWLVSVGADSLAAEATAAWLEAAEDTRARDAAAGERRVAKLAAQERAWTTAASVVTEDESCNESESESELELEMNAAIESGSELALEVNDSRNLEASDAPMLEANEAPMLEANEASALEVVSSRPATSCAMAESVLCMCDTLEECRAALRGLGGLTLGARKRLELSWRPPPPFRLSLLPSAAVDAQRIAWLSEVASSPSAASVLCAAPERFATSFLVGDDAEGLRVRCGEAEELVKGGTLVRRVVFAIHQLDEHVEGEEAQEPVDAMAQSSRPQHSPPPPSPPPPSPPPPSPPPPSPPPPSPPPASPPPPSSRTCGCAELLLVRRASAAPPSADVCRICLDGGEEGTFADEDTLRLGAEAVAALSASSATSATSASPASAIGALPCGRLLRDVCACRGSAAAVHEGCLVRWLGRQPRQLAASQTCGVCHQGFVGAAALVLARLAQRLKLVQADDARGRLAEASAAASAAGQADASSLGAVASARLEADAAELDELQAQHDAAVQTWQAGRYQEAIALLDDVLAELHRLHQAPEAAAAEVVAEPAAEAAAAAAASVSEEEAIRSNQRQSEAIISKEEAMLRLLLAEQREALELSASHNLGLALHDAGARLDEATALVIAC